MTKEQVVFALGLAWITLLLIHLNMSQATPQKSSDQYIPLGVSTSNNSRATVYFIDVNKNKVVGCGGDSCSSIAIP